MDLTLVRIVAHLLLIGWATAIAILMVLARGHSIRIVHVSLGLVGLGLFVLWLFGLVISMKSTGIVAREMIVLFLAALELGAGVSGWLWLIVAARSSFRFQIRSKRLADY